MTENMSKTSYTILINEKFGRYLVASRNIKAGELILSENPTLIGPPISGLLNCFNCCKEIRRTAFVLCSECNAAILCNVKCTGKFHTEEECQIFKKKNVNGKIIAENHQIILPLRCLLLKTINLECWEKFMMLESHLHARRNTAIWKRHKIAVEDILRDMSVLSEDDIKEELIQKICGILDVNTFEVRPPNSNSITNPEKQCLRGLYIEAALMAHDCTANTLLAVDDEFILTIKASVDIPKNSTIFFNYANVLQGSIDRKQHLREGKYFECFCKRCNDPTELDTNISSLKCHKCLKGFVKTVAPNDPKSVWKCSCCGKNFVHSLVNVIVEEGRRLIEDLNQTGIGAMEKLHMKLLTTFHPNHFLLLDLQQNMVGVYSLYPPNINNLKQKINICQNLLRVISVIEPGISRLKALISYQLQSAMLDLANMNYQEKLISVECLLINLKTAEDTLKESIKYLLHEPAKSPEGKIVHTALSELKLLRMSIINIQNDFLSRGIVRGRNVKTEGTGTVTSKNEMEETHNSRKKQNRKNKNQLNK